MSRRLVGALVVVLLLGLLASGCKGEVGGEPEAGVTPPGGAPDPGRLEAAAATALVVVSVEGMT